ncbi:Non-specific serine/threonine protein kinase protein [Dioscorea alata]|uniref:Non-specific serine/threonine protein kinase protein n=1 Tax=Dioscorea alata TaxID=55571 RepID=A0ACB7UYT4_DIOAL|nr:Non-specific serine/threonine protein kinase protein [Dioscorea alata]
MSEEEYQLQLLLPILDSEFRDDPDRDQIRVAKLLSLGKQQMDPIREEDVSANEYNVLDYKDSVLDGFYDVLGLSISASEGKIPSLVALQNRNLEQVTQRILLDCPAEVGILVKRISELVAGHMGGIVKDASIMLARCILPIGCIKLGLCRHRALLFKVLADKVGVPCKLVKGSQYTGVGDGAVNIIKLDNGRCVLLLNSFVFSEMNPFQEIRVRKTSGPPKITDNKKHEYQRHRESIALLPARPQHLLIWKNRPACNEVPNTKQYKYLEGILPRKEIGVNDLNASSSHQSTVDGKALLDGSSGAASSFTTGRGTSDSKMNGALSAGCPSEFNKLNISSGLHQDGKMYIGQTTSQASKQLNQPIERKNRNEDQIALQSSAEMNERINDIEKHDQKKHLGDSFMWTDMTLKIPESSSSTLEVRSSSLDSMLDDVAEPEILWEHLVIGERIGLGYGKVYHEDWNGTEFDGDALDKFRREVSYWLWHPNVVLFMGAVTRPFNLLIVSEFFPRGSLYRILHRPNSQIVEKQRIKMVLNVAKGMNCLQTSIPTIVHCDLKSPSLLVDKNWTVKVCDFGLSRLKHCTFLSSKSTAGTPKWMAQQVLRNEPSNEKCDVYSFGVILWELSALRMPWSGMTPMQVVDAVDPLVAKIIWQCWQKDPNLRPAFVDLTTALKSLQWLVVPAYQDAQNPALAQEIPINTTP